MAKKKKKKSVKKSQSHKKKSSASKSSTQKKRSTAKKKSDKKSSSTQAKAEKDQKKSTTKKDHKKAKVDTKSLKSKGKSSKEIALAEKISLDHSPYSIRQYFTNRYGKHVRKYKKPVFWVLKIVGVFLGLGVLGFISIFLVFGRDLPNVTQLKEMNFAETTIIYDREGNILYSIFSEENRDYVPLSYIDEDVIQATLAIEDKKFYDHFGFDPVAIVRAQLKNLEEDDTRQGASTITQQLAKNVFLSPEKTYERKIKELLLSLQIEYLFEKDEILEMYLNKIAYGSNAFGVEAASKTFFGKSSHDLSLVEATVLAALPKAPSQFSPYGQNKNDLMGYCTMDQPVESLEEVMDEGELVASAPPEELAEEALPEASAEGPEAEPAPRPEPKCSGPDDPNYVKGRKDLVLERMVEDGYITQDEVISAWRDGFDLEFLDPVHKIEAPHFVFYVKELLEKKYGKELVESGGLEVVTTLDPRLQSLAEDVIAERADFNQSRLGANNSSIVALDPRTGHVLAMVGSRNYWDEAIDGQVNVATSLRQPGSSFKPLVYAAAIQNGGIGSGTILGDYKTVFERNYTPSNSDNSFKGRMTARRALASSRNIPAIKAFYIAGGEDKLLEFLDKLGIVSLRSFKEEFNKQLVEEEKGWTFHFGPPMAIGSGELSLLELVGGYAVMANGGVRAPVNPILEVRDRNGNVIEKFEDKGEQVVDPQVAYILNSILADVYARPGGTWRNTLTIPGHTVAAKTGTSNKKLGRTNYPNNLLTLGYTPSIALGVWVGNTDGERLYYNAWGLTGAAPMWKMFMERALEDVPDEPFPEPEGLIWKGSEVFPSFMEQKNYDAQFVKIKKKEDDEEKEEENVPVVVPESDFVSTKPDEQEEVIATPEPLVEPAPAPELPPEPEPTPAPEPAPTAPAPTEGEVPYGF